MSRGLKIVFVLSCCFLWEAQAFSQVRVRFDATFGQEEIRIGFREQTYKVKLDESGIGKITIPDSLVPGYAVLYGPRNAYSFYLVPGQQQEITRLNGQEIKFAGAAKAINIYLNSPFLNNRDPGYEKGEEEFLKAWALMPGRLQSHLDSLPLPADFKKSERKRLYYVACHSLLDYPLRHARLLRRKVIPREKGITGKYRNCFRRILQLMNSGNTASFSGMVYNCWEKEKKLKQVNRWIS